MYLAPLKLVLSVVLIWQLIGWPCLVGVVTVVIGQGINVLIAKGMLHFERERRVASDTKTHKISQLVESLVRTLPDTLIIPRFSRITSAT